MPTVRTWGDTLPDAGQLLLGCLDIALERHLEPAALRSLVQPFLERAKAVGVSAAALADLRAAVAERCQDAIPAG